jgi:uncharacterized repeat protein (TIGR01451 family)
MSRRGPTIAPALGLLWAGAAGLAAAQEAPPPPLTPPAVVAAATPADPAAVPPAAPGALPLEAVPGTAALGPGAPGTGPAAAALDPAVQVVRFSGPEGVRVEVLGPATEPAPVGDGGGLATFGMRVGVSYQLRLSNLPDRPGVELFPTVQLVGHLHRPPHIDPGKYPIRIPLRLDDLDDVTTRGQLVTQVVYLEDPEQAIPVSMPRDQVPIVDLSPAEDPLKVAPALGRVMAVVRIGGRQPTPDELTGTPMFTMGSMPCPFRTPEGAGCGLPCGPPPRCEAPPPGQPWIPKDEYLCDGGDGNDAASFAGDGSLSGIDPRDALMRFNDGRRSRLLPTNTVCLYAPRFASVRSTLGPNEATRVEILKGNDQVERQMTGLVRQSPKKFVENRTAELSRHRARASGMIARQAVNSHKELRVLHEGDSVVQLNGHTLVQNLESQTNREKPAQENGRVFLQGIKLAEGLVVTGIAEGAREQVMAWKPQEVQAVEEPPNKPGLAVVKQVDAQEAEPGDVVTFTITYRNMGNVPLRAVSVVDSLLPRLEYVLGSARGPAGAVFTAGENRAGSTELRWDIGTIQPGAAGAVSFQAKVR